MLTMESKGAEALQSGTWEGVVPLLFILRTLVGTAGVAETHGPDGL